MGEKFAEKHNCKILKTPLNTISIAMSIEGLNLK